jgi:Mn-dependent DtxR family transcriptional regulator
MAQNDGEEIKLLEAAALELHTLGYIEFRDEETFWPTEKGLIKAKQIILALPMADRLLVMASIPEITEDILENQLDGDDPPKTAGAG